MHLYAFSLMATNFTTKMRKVLVFSISSLVTRHGGFCVHGKREGIKMSRIRSQIERNLYAKFSVGPFLVGIGFQPNIYTD